MKSLFAVTKVDNGTYHHWIDFFRFLAAFAVLIFHYKHFYYFGGAGDASFFQINGNLETLPFYNFLQFFYNHGMRGVDFFWVISGFVFSAVYFNKKVDSFTFFKSRFSRLYPLHFLTLIIITLLQIISLNIYDHFQIYPINDIYHFILNIFFISSWGFESGNNFNWPIWSVSIELIIYFVFFVVMSKLFKKGILYPAFMTTIFILLYYLNSFHNIFSSLIFLCGYYFFAGSCIFFIRTLCLNYNKVQFIPLLSCFLILIGYFSVGKILNNHDIYVFPALVLFISYLDLTIKKIGMKISYLGNLCYGVYLWHVPIQVFLMILMFQYSIEKRLEILNSNIFIIFFFTIVMFIAHLSYKYFEKPMRMKINYLYK